MLYCMLWDVVQICCIFNVVTDSELNKTQTIHSFLLMLSSSNINLYCLPPSLLCSCCWHSGKSPLCRCGQHVKTSADMHNDKKSKQNIHLCKARKDCWKYSRITNHFSDMLSKLSLVHCVNTRLSYWAFLLERCHVLQDAAWLYL